MFQDIDCGSLGYLFIGVILVCVIVGGVVGMFWKIDKPNKSGKHV